jgi:catechol 2,3-dioxygenase-like lactoylglutathione lyase family enzyme
MTVRLASVVVGGAAAPWVALGFTVTEGGLIAFGNGAIELDGSASGAVALRVDDVDGVVGGADIDGVPLLAGPGVPATDHANGCFELDHVVIMTPSIERTSAAIASVLGLPQRRIRETDTVRQAFHRFDERGCIVELVETSRVERPTLWGLVVNTTDLDAFVAAAGPELVSAPKPAVQPSRRIVTVRSGAGLPVALAVMSA